MALKVTLVVVPSPKYHHLLVTHLELLSENLNAIYTLTKKSLNLNEIHALFLSNYTKMQIFYLKVALKLTSVVVPSLKYHHLLVTHL